MALKISNSESFQYAVVLVEPEYALNIGYVARAMMNFGISRLYIVAKARKRIDMEEASKFASHASAIVKSARFVRNFETLRRKFQIVIGTTAIRGVRKSNLTRKTLDPEEAIHKILLQYARSEESKAKSPTVCFVFGRDTTGLTNEEIKLCDYCLSIETGTDYNTLNISHAAVVLFYIVYRHIQREEKKIRKSQVAESSSRAERERVVALFKDVAMLSDFQKYKQAKLAEALERLLNRGDPSLREVYLLMGLASKARTKLKLYQSRQMKDAEISVNNSLLSAA